MTSLLDPLNAESWNLWPHLTSLVYLQRTPNTSHQLGTTTRVATGPEDPSHTLFEIVPRAHILRNRRICAGYAT